MSLSTKHKRGKKRLLYTEEDEKREKTIPKSEGVKAEAYRSPWRRDYARLVHSPAFRRLQGKTQLFPGLETDFFRTRLTHSLEVAQIAKSIAVRLNHIEDKLNRNGYCIDTDLVETAGLSHDIGHPPFGHNGEKALDNCMRHKGGFEGNAQTLRILSKIEKREKNIGTSIHGVTKRGTDGRKGLNLTYRTLAAVLKYDKEIPFERIRDAPLVKGYYRLESNLVRNIKQAVTGQRGFRKPFKTIECQIMDIADDIAYSTYDLEDAFKANFLTPVSLLGTDEKIITAVSTKVSQTIGQSYPPGEVTSCLVRVFHSLIETTDGSAFEDSEYSAVDRAQQIALIHRTSDSISSSGYFRSSLTSELVGRFIRGVRLKQFNDEIPALSKIGLDAQMLEEVEVLKHVTYQSLIMSPRLKVAEYRGLQIVKYLFEVLTNIDDHGYRLLPQDVQELYHEIDSEYRARVICDFIAGMTDRYAIEFYGRLTSENPETIFKPH